MENARKEARNVGLHHVYVGNMFGHDGEQTRCHVDDTLLIKRVGYKIIENNIKAGCCPSCGTAVPGRWET